MHEVSLMQDLLRIVERAASEEPEGRVTEIHLRIGEMAGVNVDSLTFTFEILSNDTRAEGEGLVIEKVPFLIRCEGCGEDFESEEMRLRCPGCGGTRIEVVSGREMEVDHIIMDDGG